MVCRRSRSLPAGSHKPCRSVAAAAPPHSRRVLCASVRLQVGQRKVAIKKITDTFRDLTDAKRILRELRLLRHLGGHENISWILDIMVSAVLL